MIVVHGGEDDDAAHQKIKNEFDRGHLGAGPASQRATCEQQNQVAADAVENGIHRKLLRHDEDIRREPLMARNLKGNGGATYGCGLEREPGRQRGRTRREGVEDSAMLQRGGLGLGDTRWLPRSLISHH